MNEAILRLIRLCEDQGVSWADNLPISASAPYLSTPPPTPAAPSAPGFRRFWRTWGGPPRTLPPTPPTPPSPGGYGGGRPRPRRRLRPGAFGAAARLLRDRPLPLPAEARKVIGVRYELSLRSLSSYYVPPYTFAEEVDAELISILNDGDYAGVVVETESVREYKHGLRRPPHRHHRLPGRKRSGRLPRPGVRQDDLVGKFGAELAFESYLKGTDGKRTITTNEDGKITGEVYTQEPQRAAPWPSPSTSTCRRRWRPPCRHHPSG